MSPWGWTPERNLGIWRHGSPGLRPFLAAVPYLTLGLIILMFHLIGGTMTSPVGVLFELPECSAIAESEHPDLVAMAMPTRNGHDIDVYFDDMHYQMGDAKAMSDFRRSLAARAERCTEKSLLLLADRRISTDAIVRLSETIRQCGVRKLLFAGKLRGDEVSAVRRDKFAASVVRLTKAQQNLVVRAVRTAWHANDGADYACTVLPAELPRLGGRRELAFPPVRESRLKPVLCEAGPFLPSRRAAPPSELPPVLPVELKTAFPRDDLLKLN